VRSSTRHRPRTTKADFLPFPSSPCSATLSLSRQSQHLTQRLNFPQLLDFTTIGTPVLAKRTYRELKLLKHIQHENIISLSDIFISPLEDIYFVTELLGTDLHRLLTSRPLEKQFIQYFLYQILVRFNFRRDTRFETELTSRLRCLTARTEIRSLCGSCSPRSQAFKHSRQRELRSQDLRFRTCSTCGSSNDWLRLNKVLPSARDHAHVAEV